MQMLDIKEVKNAIKMLGITKVFNKIKENKGYLFENDFLSENIILVDDAEKYVHYNTEINDYYKKEILIQMDNMKKYCTSYSFVYCIKNVSHAGHISISNGIVGVIKK